MSGHLRITQNAKSNLLNSDFFGHSDSAQCSEFMAKRCAYAHDSFVHIDSFKNIFYFYLFLKFGCARS